MKIWHTAVAFLVLLALGGVLYYLNQQSPKPSPEEFPKQDLFTFQSNQVAEFTLEMPDKPAATFRSVAASQPSSAADGQQSNQARWEVVSPPGIAADSQEIQGFVDGLPEIKSNLLDLQSPASLAEYGLDPPQRTFKFRLKGGQEVTLFIGKENPMGFGRYGKLGASAEVFLLDLTDINSLMGKTLFDFRDKRILPVEMSQEQQLALDFYRQGGASAPAEKQETRSRKPLKMILTRMPNGDWQLTEPAMRTDHGSTAALANLLESAQVQSFEEENPASLSRYGLAPPNLRLNVKTSNGSYSLLIGNQISGEPIRYYAKNSVWPQVFTVDQSVYSQLNQDLEHYRNRHLFDVSGASRTRRVEIQTADQSLRFDRKGDAWVNSQNAQQKVDASKVDGFLNYIYALRIQHYPTDQSGQFAQYGLDKPWMSVKVVAGEDNHEETVLFGRKSDHFYAARQGEASVYEMAPAEPDNMEFRLKELTS